MKLTVVIPYYKATYFEETLEALVNQTDKRFKVIVGDDAAAVAAEDIAGKFSDRLNITCKRFSENLGSQDLAGQWNRCLELVNDCEWVWFIPDDDVPGNTCVSDLHDAFSKADENNTHLISLSTEIIGNDSLQATKNLAPHIMTGSEFLISYLSGVEYKNMTLGTCIYRHSRLQKIGGFVSFPCGWCSDHATALAVATTGNVISIPNAKLGFRMSGENISSLTSNGEEKLSARAKFVTWLFNNTDARQFTNASSYKRRTYLVGEYFYIHVYRFNLRTAVSLARSRSELIGGTGLPGALKATAMKGLVSFRSWYGKT